MDAHGLLIDKKDSKSGVILYDLDMWLNVNGEQCGVPNGIRTRVLALKGPYPGPLDDGDMMPCARP